MKRARPLIIMLVVFCLTAACLCGCNASVNSNSTSNSTIENQNSGEQNEIEPVESIEDITLSVDGVILRCGMTVADCIEAGMYVDEVYKKNPIKPGYLSAVILNLHNSEGPALTVMVDSQSKNDVNVDDAVVVGFSFMFVDFSDELNLKICGLDKKSSVSDFEKLLGPKSETITTLANGHMWYNKELVKSDYQLYCCLSQDVGESEMRSFAIYANAPLLYNDVAQ